MNRLNLEKIVSYLFDQIKRSIRRANKQKKRKKRGRNERISLYFLLFFEEISTEACRKTFKRSVIGNLWKFHRTRSIEIYLFSTLIDNSSFLFSFPYSIFPPVETRSFAALYLWWKTGLEPCFHERCVHTVQLYIYIYIHTLSTKHVRAHALVGGERRGTKSEPISIPRDGPTRPVKLDEPTS